MVTSETAMAASIVLSGQVPLQNAIGANANRVPIMLLPLDEQFVSYRPGCSALVPIS